MKPSPPAPSYPPVSPDMRPPKENERLSEMTLGGIVICGGFSRRMGRDKALIQLDGQSMLARAAHLVDQTCQGFLLACGTQPRYEQMDLPLVLDKVPDGGPLAGIAAGLDALETSHALVIACDMPRLTKELLAGLFERALAGQFDVCFLATERGVEPLCAVYSKKCLPAIERALDLGMRKVTSFLQVDGLGTELRVGRVSLGELPGEPSSVCNVNTPQDLVRARDLGNPRTEGSQ